MDGEPEERSGLLQYLERLGWQYEGTGLDRFVVTPEGPSSSLRLYVSLGDAFLSVTAPDIATLPKRGQTAVFERLMKLHWGTYLPKYEWDESDGELRAVWYLPAKDGPPTYGQFYQTIRALTDALVEQLPQIEKALETAKRTSAPSEERVPESAQLRNLGRDLVSLAERHEILPMYVREDLVERLVSLLGGPRQQILLVGESGTGKNALVHALATWVASGDGRIDRGRLRGRHIYECVPAAFQLSVHYAHELETKTQLVAENCMAEDAILFLDQAHLAVTFGRVSEMQERTIAKLLHPFLSRNEVTLIGATDHNGLKLMLKEDPGFAQLFHVLDVPEPSLDETLLMVRDRMDKFRAGQAASRVFTFEPGLEHRVVELSGRFLRTQRYPGKALVLLHDTVARLSEETQDRVVTAADVEAAIAASAGLRDDLVRTSWSLRREDVEAALSEQVLGQEAAVKAVADVVIRYKAELSPPERPLATMLFVGPTGVGKTQLARSLARYLFGTEDALLRYDMSEYAAFDGFARLCGRRGVQEEPGRLIGDVSARPFSVVLLDEIEKAHESVFDVLLQVLGEGRLTDEGGRTASFLNTVIILTSNVGSRLFGRTGVGFGGEVRRPSAHDLERELEREFRPEFLNRISHRVTFEPLPEDTIRAIARREVSAVAKRSGLRNRGLDLQASEALVDHLALEGFDPKYGARAMQRTVEDLVVAALAEALAADPGLNSARLLLDWQEGAVTLQRGDEAC